MNKVNSPLAWIAPLIGGSGAILMGFLFKGRLLPFLKDDLIFSGGRYVSTADWSAFMARNFFLFAPVCFAVAIFQYLRWRKMRITTESQQSPEQGK